MDWYLAALKNYAGFSGRARREEYWMFLVGNIVVWIALGIGDVVLGVPILTRVYSAAVLIPWLAVTFRRLHDTGRSAWWLLVIFLPFFGFIALLVYLASKGEPDANRYGPSPKAHPARA
ncbi:DUF805 domain-containing protein [Kitasatospora sp. GP82]|uniref:DUF805 domain-containing protein n=1 Tax=Kitasatospora sp. GP82 TaxID=3035089 RepID=UPI0024759F1E|nr:DUF805 domain-containing protein [Kitasatospora sp. GP82]MDH6126759.1 uncharacterized membrane protein YhaH (DUF805 family) [Kitasatospora sp. GP82]